MISDVRLSSEVKIEVTVATEGYGSRTFFMQAEVRSTVRKDGSDREAVVISIANGERIKGASLRTITGLDQSELQDYVAIEKVGPSWKLTLLRETNAGYEISGETLVPQPTGELLTLHRLDLDSDGASDYVLIYREPPAPNKTQPTFLIQSFDTNLQAKSISLGGKTGASIAYDNADTVMADRFQWMKHGNRRVPAWVSRGMTPASEKPAYDPWNPNPIEPPLFRIYYIGKSGLRTIKIPDEYAVIAQLNTSPEQRERGAIPILFAKGRGSEMSYATAEAVDGRLDGFRSISLGRFRALRGVDLKELTDLSPNPTRTGTVFATDSFRGAQRVTALVNKADGSRVVDEVIDQTVKADSIADTVTNIAGVFAGDQRKAAVTLNIYDMQYYDLKTGETATTSLRRFSFLPVLFFYNIFFPASLTDSSNPHGERLPGIYVPPGLGLSQGLEVIAPRYDGGRLQTFMRPARLRLEAPQGCEAMGNTLPASSTQPTRAVFFCGDRFLRVALAY